MRKNSYVIYEWRLVTKDENREVLYYDTLEEMPFSPADIESGLELSLTRRYVYDNETEWEISEAWVENWKLWIYFDQDLRNIGKRVPKRFQKEIDKFLAQ